MDRRSFIGRTVAAIAGTSIVANQNCIIQEVTPDEIQQFGDAKALIHNNIKGDLDIYAEGKNKVKGSITFGGTELVLDKFKIQSFTIRNGHHDIPEFEKGTIVVLAPPYTKITIELISND